MAGSGPEEPGRDSRRREDRLSLSFLGHRRWVADVAIALVTVVGFAAAPSFYGNELLLLNMALYVALAQGINVIYGFTGYLPFGYVGFFGAGAYGASLSIRYLHLPAPAAMVVGGAAGAVTGALLLPLLRLAGPYFAITSLAAAEAIYAIMANPTLDPITQGTSGTDLASVYNSSESYLAAVCLVGLSVLVVAWLRHGAFGLSLRAIRSNYLAALGCGIDVAKARGIAWLISATIAGLAGAIFAWAIATFYASAVFDLSVSVFAIVFALFGGIGTTAGPIVGAVLLYGLYSAIGITAPSSFQLIYGSLIVALVLFLPGGLFGLWQKAFGRFARSSSRSGASPAPSPKPTQQAPAANPDADGKGQPVLEVEGLCRSFGALRAVDSVSFELARGEILGLVGPNGSGKTTVINLLSGVYQPSSGTIRLRGRPVTRMRSHELVRQGLARTFQIPQPLSALTVAENVAVAARHGSPGDRARVDPLEVVGLGQRREVVARDLTASDQKRLDLARALATGPDVLLVDEIGAGLSPAELAELALLLRSLAASGIAVVVVEHLMGFLAQVTDHVLVLDAGQEIYRGPLRDAVRDEQVVKVFLGA